MAQRLVERKLVAILAADVVGYSRLMGADELGTLHTLKALRREIIDPAISQHHGRIVKLMGDGLLAEFGSAVEAVACAVSIQHILARGTDTLPREPPIVLRCGINLGDVVVEARDLYGDGVNVAARLEAFCEPGGICISRAVRDQVRDKLDLAFVDLGEQRLKNIARPIRLFQLPAAEIANLHLADAPSPGASGSRHPRIMGTIKALMEAAGTTWSHLAKSGQGMVDRPAPAPGSSSASAANRPPARASKPHLSIVVLPFASPGEDATQDYFADALTANITTDLSRMANSFVISTHTAFTYKGQRADPEQIGRDLGVYYLLQGSVRRTGDRVRVHVDLVNTTSGAQIWGDRFDHDVVAVAALEDEMTRQIARALGVELVEAESRWSRQLRPDSPDAVDLAMQGWSILNQPPDQERVHAARRLFEGSLKQDPHLAPALVGLASTYVTEADYWAPMLAVDYTSKAEEAVGRALVLDPKAAYAHQIKAWIASVRLQIPEAIAEAKLAIELDRNDWVSHVLLSLGELMAGHPERARTLAEQALRLSPRDPGLWAPLCLLGRARVILGEPEAAIDPLLQAIASAPGAAFLRIFLAAAYGRAGRDTEARAIITEFLRMSPDLMVGQSDSAKTMMRVQLELAARGYYLGTVDGRAGPMHRQALIAFQREQGLAETGDLNNATLVRLNMGST